ncbi:hypothetical protein ACI78R_01365 [Geodermatophilus sp. SYSU D01106]
MTALIRLTPEQVEEAQEMGAKTFERWQRHRGHYRNLYGSHVRGKIGEIAVEEWAHRQGIAVVESIFRDPSREREADLLLGSALVDVKTWDASGWPEWGRCVAPTQLPALRRKATLLVWCYVEEHRYVDVTVAGWNTLDEIAATALRPTGPAGREVLNHQLPDSEVRPLDSLAVLLRS